jgi:hypothetical protein
MKLKLIDLSVLKSRTEQADLHMYQGCARFECKPGHLL